MAMFAVVQFLEQPSFVESPIVIVSTSWVSVRPTLVRYPEEHPDAVTAMARLHNPVQSGWNTFKAILLYYNVSSWDLALTYCEQKRAEYSAQITENPAGETHTHETQQRATDDQGRQDATPSKRQRSDSTVKARRSSHSSINLRLQPDNGQSVSGRTVYTANTPARRQRSNSTVMKAKSVPNLRDSRSKSCGEKCKFTEKKEGRKSTSDMKARLGATIEMLRHMQTEYDVNTPHEVSKKTLRYRKYREDLIELLPHSGIYIRKEVDRKIREKNTATARIRMTLEEVFSDDAIHKIKYNNLETHVLEKIRMYVLTIGELKNEACKKSVKCESHVRTTMMKEFVNLQLQSRCKKLFGV